MAPQKSLKFLKYFIYFFFITIFLLILSFFHLLAPVEGLLSKVTSPFASFFNGVALRVKDAGQSIGELGSLQKENQDLKNRVNELTVEVSKLGELKVENESLRKQLDFVKSTNYKTIVASVISKDPSSFLKILFINRGTNSGIKKNMAVVSDGYLIGKVHEVNSDTAKVILLTDSNFEMSGIIQESRASGLIKGQIGSGLTMETISKDKEIKTGNMVVTSNLEPEIPEGLLIGRVTR